MAIHQITNPSNALGPIWIKNTRVAPGETYRWYENDPCQTTAYIKAYPISEVPMSHAGPGRDGSYVAAPTYEDLVAENDRLRAAAKTSVDTKCATIQHNRDLMNALSVVMTCLSELDAKHLTAIKDGVRRVETDRAANKAIRRA